MDKNIAAAIQRVNSPSDAVLRDHRVMSEMGKRIRALRKAAGLTQVQLARSVGVSQSAISDLERGDTDEMMGPTLRGLCNALHTNQDWLMSGKGSPAPAVKAGFDEGELLSIFRSLPPPQQAALLTVARSMQAGHEHTPSVDNPYPRRRRIAQKQP